MVARNDITGDAIQSRTSSKAYSDNYDTIFRKNKKTDTEQFDEQVVMKDEVYDLEEGVTPPKDSEQQG